MVPPTRRFLLSASLTGLIITFSSLLSSCQDKRLPIHLGQSVEECTASYGEGKVQGYRAPHNKSVYYNNAPDGEWVEFNDGVVVSVKYGVRVDDLEDQKLKRYLEINAQGHQWTLKSISTYGGNHASWVRDDGVEADYVDSTFSGLSITPAIAKTK